MKTKSIEIPLKEVTLKGELAIPKDADGVVIFSHGSGSSRFSPRNKFVAEMLHQQNFGTLLFDLLTEEEDAIYENTFNIDLLTSRLIDVTDWLLHDKNLKGIPIGYFGASTGAASAMGAASHFKNKIKAIVSRGGRPDLALNHLPSVTAPTLFLVGELDYPVIEMNKLAISRLHCEKDMQIISGATHLFKEPGKLIEVVELSISWYKEHLTKQKFTSEKATFAD
ncbi:MAG: hypothetical protein RL308_2613 [Bacteroidota bacterium]|jgi:dienelactone hydrolase